MAGKTNEYKFKPAADMIVFTSNQMGDRFLSPCKCVFLYNMSLVKRKLDHVIVKLACATTIIAKTPIKTLSKPTLTGLEMLFLFLLLF